MAARRPSHRVLCVAMCIWASVPLLAAVCAAAADPPGKSAQTAVFAGGCFWGVDAVFKHVKGVEKVVSGYAGGKLPNPTYELVSTGATGYAESVEVTYDPSKVSYEQLLKVFFRVAHNPTELNRQGPDEGTQYRSAIFYSDQAQAEAARKYIADLERRKVFSQPIVTQVVALGRFYPAEDYHQNFLALHPDNPYIVINDLPKLDHLRSECPDQYKQ